MCVSVCEQCFLKKVYVCVRVYVCAKSGCLCVYVCLRKVCVIERESMRICAKIGICVESMHACVESVCVKSVCVGVCVSV